VNARCWRAGTRRSKRNLEGIGSLAGSLVPGAEARATLRTHGARLPQHEEYVDAAGLILPLDVRGRRPGDRFVPLGMHAPKKLHDFFIDERVPRPLRSRVPLVISGGAIVWVVGLRIDERFKVTPQTAEAVHLQFVPE
jgi:tRNA(Ile)-lysidine synthetase-like protein